MTGEANLTVQGAGGGGGDSHTPVESPNSLVSKTTARVLFLTSDGEVGGLTDQANKLKSVYFNNVPVMNADGSKNFANVTIDERYGLPSQAVMPGYVSAASTFTVASKVTTATPVTYTTSTSAPDAVRVTIRFPALFAQQSNGDTTGTEVQFEIHRRLGAGAFSLVRTVTKNDKCNSPADADYLIERPAGAGTWSVKVVRVTADNSLSTVANDIYFQTAAELQYAQLPYNNRAYLGLTVTAEATGSTFPLVSFDTYGLKVKVPSNYNVATRVYTGGWDGNFSGTKQVCDNPAWVLYDLLTSTTHGMGLSASDIDQYSFYDAAVYCDGSVPALVKGVISGTEPRYTFNYQLMAQDSAWTTIQNIAASMGAAVYTSGNRVKLVQDRPTSFSRVITNSNVIEGLFEYSSSQKNSRTSACIVYWNNPNDNWLSVPCYYEDSAGTARYGLNTKEVTGLGITTEGQAMRLAKWHVDTSLNNTDAVIFKVGFANAGLEPGEVVKLMDTDYAAVMNEAKVVSSTATSVTLDREITVAVGNTFDVAGADGTTLYTRTITSAGTSATVSFSGAALDVVAGADFVLTGAVSPRLFKVTSSKEDSPGVYVVSAVEYDPNKFGRVDSTPTGITPTFQAPTQIPSAPQNLAFKETNTNTDGVIRRTLNVSWTRPASGTVKNYVLRYRRASTSWDEVTLNATSYDIQGALDGAYEVKVFPRSALDVLGPEANGTWTMASIGGGSTLLNAPTSLQLIGGGTTFTGPDINFQWTNPSSNGTIAATLRDFEVKFIETTGSTTVRTVYVPAVAAGTTQATSYTFSMNTFDGGPRRSMQVQVRCRDAAGNVSSPATATFTNAVIATVQNIAVSSANGGVKITYTLPSESDFGGVLIWRSTTSGFTPASGNLVYDTTDNYIADMVPFGTTYYYKLAAYDSFGKPLDGAGLNISAQQSGSAASPDGIPEVASLPNPSGYSGPKIVFLTTDGQLYSYISGAWQATIPPVSGIADGAVTIAKFASGLKPVEILGALPTTGNTQGRLVFLTGDNKLYRYNGSAFVATTASTDITGTLTDAQLSAIAAAKITGQIVASQITDASISTAKFASGLKPVEVLGSLPASGNTAGRVVFLTTDNKLYRYNGSAFVATVPSTDITGTLTDAQLTAIAAAKITGTIASTQIADAAITTAKFAAGIEPITNVSSVPGTLSTKTILNTTDGKLYRWNGSAYVASVPSTDITGTLTNAQIADLAATKLTGSITTTQITDNAISTAKIAAGAITTAKIAADAVTANEIAANAITATELSAGAVTTAKIAASAVTANELSANSVTAGKIAAGVVTATEIASNAIRTDKLLVTGRGAALNDDPGCQDASAWVDGGHGPTAVQTTVADAVLGNQVFRSVGVNGSSIQTSKSFPVSAGKKYRLSAWFRSNGSNGANYLRLLDQVGVQIIIPEIDAFAVTGLTWVKKAAEYIPPAGTNRVYIRLILNWTGTTGYVEATDVRLEEKAESDLIVDGAITANKILAGSITSTQIAADTITAANIAANAIGATEISAGAVTTAKIAAGAVTANEIAANTITAGKIAVGAITATEIAAGAIRTDKLLVSGSGASLWLDTNYKDTSAWIAASWNSVPLQQAVADGVTGSTTMRSGSIAASARGATRVPTVIGKRYRVSAYVRRSADCNGKLYVRVDRGTTSTGSYAETTIGIENITPATTWTRYTGEFVAAYAWASPMMLLNYSGSVGWMEAQDVRLEEMIGADLIVDGSVSASKIAANTITSSQIAAGTITSSQIAADTITAANIAAGAITASELAANSVIAGKIAAGAITATEIAADAIRSDKLLVTGRGKALNDDPSCADISAWAITPGAVAVQLDATAPVGKYSLRCTNASQVISREYPVEAGKTYKISLYAKQVSGGGVLYVRQYCYNATGTLISYLVTGLTPVTSSLEGLTVPGTWTRYTGFTTPAAGSVRGQVFLHLNWNTTGVTDITDVRAEEYIGADLIVDGSIVAQKIATDAITSDKIAANAITAGKIAAAAIDASKIAATTITGDKLVANTITGDKIAAGTVTATNIDSRNLTIKDAAGTVIFSAGVPLTSSNITPASTWLNSNVSIASNGALTGAGGGQVTIAGLGYTGELNATYGAIAGSTLKDSSGAAIPVDGIRNNLANVDWWVRGASIPWSVNSEYNNLIAVSPTGGDTPGSGYASIPGPRGGADIVWYAQENAGDSGPGGGWNNGTHAPLSTSKTYRFVLPVRRLSAGVGTAYWGTNGVCNLNTTTGNGNPYFASIGLPTTDRWYLLVGYVFPAGSINNTHDGAGVYDCKTGQLIQGGNNWTFNAGYATLGHRAYQYYAPQYAAMVFGRPLISLVDGTEPSLREYFESTAVLNTAISISGNSIVGIGTGSGTEVANSALVPSISSAATTANWGTVASRPANVAALSGSEPILNTAIAVNTTTGAISGIGTGDGTSVANNRTNFITAPGGGFFGINAPTQYGAIRIKLPSVINVHYPMLKMTVEIYEYYTGRSCTLSIAGHTSGTGWYNVTASLIGGNVEYPVRFGHDGTNYVVWIGDPATEVWDYPQVFIKDVVVGYTHATPDIWSTGWAITLSTAAVTNVTATVLDTYPAADWSKTARKPTTLAGINSSEGSKLSGIAAGATVGATFGTNISGQITAGNASTYIANAAIGTAQVGQLTASNIAANTITTDRLEVSAVTARSSTSNSGASYGFTSATSVNTGLVTANNVTSTGAPMLVGGVVTVGIGFTSIIGRVNVLCQLFRDGVLCATIQNNRFPVWVNGSSYQYEDFYHFNTLLPATTAGTKQFSVQVIVGFEFNNGNPATVSGTLISGFNIFTQENKV